MEYVLLSFIAFGASYLGVALIYVWTRRHNMLDLPNARSSHIVPTPRGGGLAIVLVTLIGLTLWQRQSLIEIGFLGYLGGSILIATVGWLDDLYHLSATLRLGAQALAAGILLAAFGIVEQIYLPFVGSVDMRVLGTLLLLFWIMGLTNAYNFMDGIDGIAAGQAIVAAGFWLTISFTLQITPIVILTLLLLTSSLGFLLHNVPPARIFMGDSGSTFLGFSFAALPLAMYHFTKEPQMFLLGVAFVAPFIFDTGITIVRRALRHENILQAHRSHLYQRLVKIGFAHGTASLIYVSLAFIIGMLGLLAYWYPNGALVCWILSLALLLGLWSGIVWLERQRRIPESDLST